jgi:hypothetical protein
MTKDCATHPDCFPRWHFNYVAQFAGVFKSLIGKALQKNPDCGTCDQRTQFDQLIFDPLVESGVDSEQVVLLVIDAFDECATEKAAENILRLILTYISRVPFIFRVFLTSRPESRIANVFKEYNHEVFSLRDVVRNDILLLVEKRLRESPRKFTITGEWPPTADMETLVDKCGGLFLYAALSLRFIENDRAANPRKQLKILLRTPTAIKGKPYAQLDELYLQVLRSAWLDNTEGQEDLIPRFHWVVGSIVIHYR